MCLLPRLVRSPNGKRIGRSACASPPAVALTTIGLACWVAGYLLGAPGGVRRAGRSLVDRMFSGTDWMFRFPSVPIVVYLVGVVARLYQLRTNQFGYLQNVGALSSSPSAFRQVTGLLADFAQFGLILAALDAFIVSRSFRSRIVLVVLLLAEVADGLFTGSKGDVIVSVASVGVVAVFVFGRPARRLTVGTHRPCNALGRLPWFRRGPGVGGVG